MSCFGLSEQNVEILKALALHPLANEGCSVWVFGSRARGDHSEFSDIDLLVSGRPSAACLIKVRDSLENSNLPIKVDIVLESDLASSYRENVETDKKRFV